MGDRDLGEGLLKSVAPGLGAHTHAERASRRDRRIVWSLTAATVVLWVLAAVGVLIIHFGFLIFFLPKINQLLQHPEDPQTARHWGDVVYWFGRLSGPIVSASAAVLLLAALTTILLVYASRRATLRQIQASLTLISEQLKQIADRSTSSPHPSDKTM